MNPLLLLKFIGALLLVGVIFFGSFLAYIVFNPEQAQFFVTMFNINPDDIARLLTKLVNGSFWILILFLSIFWIVALFQAIWTPKDLKRKRMTNWIIAISIGIFLFSTLAFWGFLFDRIKTTRWDNLDGTVSMSDSTLINNPDTKNLAKITSTTNLIGPITIQFDISGNAKNLEDANGLRITSFELNFDGAKCSGNTSIVSGSSPREETAITCTFDQIKSYALRGNYQVVDRLGNSSLIDIPLPSLEIRGLIDIREQKNKDGKDIITLDASSLKRIGNPRWTYLTSGKEVETDSITEVLSATPNILGLTIWENPFDRIFILEKRGLKEIEWTIESIMDPKNPLAYTFSLSGLTIDENMIVWIEWSTEDGTVICQGSSESCTYNFWTYGKRGLQARIRMANNEYFTLSTEVNIDEPILLAKHVHVTDKQWTKLNPQETYDTDLRAYIIKNILPPEEIILDARDIVTENPGYLYESEKTRWTIRSGKTEETKIGARVNLNISNSVRYTIQAQYTINKNIMRDATDTKIITETIIIDTEQKSLMPKIIVQTTSDYVPTLITVDGSESKSENGEIKKFIYNFWEWKPEAVGDAIQQYQYNTPGEKEITLTIINESGESATTKKILVLKETPRTVDFAPSLAPWVVNVPVDFSITQSSGQIEDFIWNFGDNTPTERGMSITHTFTKTGTFTITLTTVFADGTQKQMTRTYTVNTSLE